jgi:hypothetical protein
MPKSYGIPTGNTPPDPNRKQRAATPASDAQVHAAYQAHMKEAHEQFLAAHKTGNTSRPRGNSTSAPSKRGSVPGIDAAIAKSGG